MGYLFCTMSSTEIIGSLITLSLWSRSEGQAHRGIETGVVCAVPMACEAQGGWLLGTRACPVDPVPQDGGQVAGRQCGTGATDGQQGARGQTLAPATSWLYDLGRAGSPPCLDFIYKMMLVRNPTCRVPGA